ncbi:MAG: ABC transporter transmembrane domain-containing protein, partial [Bacteroidota bacterium]
MKISTIKHLFLTYKKYLGKKIYLVFFLSLFTALMEGFGITLLLPLIEQADSGGASYDSTISSIINGILQFFGVADSIGYTLLFIGIVFLFKGVLKFLDGGFKGYLAAGLMRKLKAKLYDAYNAMDYRYFIKNNTGHFINVINGQTTGMIGSFNYFLMFLTQVIMAISYLLIAFLITWQFALMAVGIGIILLLLFKTLNIYVANLSRQSAIEASTLNKFLVQLLQSFKYIASTGQNSHLRNGVISSVNKMAGFSYKQTLAKSLTAAMQEPVSVIFMIVIVAIQILVLGAAIGPILVALMLFYRGLRAVIGIQNSWQATMNAMGSIEMVETELEQTSINREPNGKHPMKPFSQAIELK